MTFQTMSSCMTIQLYCLDLAYINDEYSLVVLRIDIQTRTSVVPSPEPNCPCYSSHPPMMSLGADDTKDLLGHIESVTDGDEGLRRKAMFLPDVVPRSAASPTPPLTQAAAESRSGTSSDDSSLSSSTASLSTDYSPSNLRSSRSGSFAGLCTASSMESWSASAVAGGSRRCAGSNHLFVSVCVCTRARTLGLSVRRLVIIPIVSGCRF